MYEWDVANSLAKSPGTRTARTEGPRITRIGFRECGCAKKNIRVHPWRHEVRSNRRWATQGPAARVERPARPAPRRTLPGAGRKRHAPQTAHPPGRRADERRAAHAHRRTGLMGALRPQTPHCPPPGRFWGNQEAAPACAQRGFPQISTAFFLHDYMPVFRGQSLHVPKLTHSPAADHYPTALEFQPKNENAPVTTCDWSVCERIAPPLPSRRMLRSPNGYGREAWGASSVFQ